MQPLGQAVKLWQLSEVGRLTPTGHGQDSHGLGAERERSFVATP